MKSGKMGRSVSVITLKLFLLHLAVLAFLCVPGVDALQQRRLSQSGSSPFLLHDVCRKTAVQTEAATASNRSSESEDPRQRYDAVWDVNKTKAVKVRFVATHTRRDEQLFEFLASARLAGVPVEIIGLDWKGFSLMQRHQFIVEYIKAENLSDDDVVMMIDSDMLFTGLDLYPLLQEFVSNSPSTPEETDPRLVRLHQQRAPVLFTAENHCMRIGGVAREVNCGIVYEVLESMMASWASSEGFVYNINLDGKRNENRYLNNGLIMGRVWAHKILREAFYDYSKTVFPADGNEWTMDQGVYADLFLNLRYWELNEGLLKATAYRKGKVGPFGLVAGMMELDYQQDFVGAYHMFNIYEKLQYTNRKLSRIKTVTEWKPEVLSDIRDGVVRCSLTPAGALMANALVSFIHKTPNVLDKNDQFGIPYTKGVNSPIWHFCGNEKSTFMPMFLQVLPVTMAADAFPEQQAIVQSIFWSAAPNKVWTVSLTPGPDGYLPLERSSKLDLTGEALCAVIKK